MDEVENYRGWNQRQSVSQVRLCTGDSTASFFRRKKKSSNIGKRVVLTLLDAVLVLVLAGAARDPLDALVVGVLGRGALL